eukprot:5206464-Alexandrium_andersonii.AAC.1
MSASLVGSEMCIRDSHQAGRGVAIAVRPPLPDDGRADHWRLRAGEVAACLLYTSDAADDM